MNRIDDIAYAEEVYDCEFSDSGHLENAWLRIGHMTGYRVDSINVTEFLAKYAIEKFESVWREHKEMKILEKAERAVDEIKAFEKVSEGA